ncbi:hypothetical protein LINGRAHAP2_LOCUS3110 [Linum grandiflorum]
MAEWSKAPDSSSGLRKRAWVQIPLLTFLFSFSFFPSHYAIVFNTFAPASVLTDEHVNTSWKQRNFLSLLALRLLVLEVLNTAY